MDYDLEIEKVCKEIKKAKAKKVLIQLPDGLKPYATKIAREIERGTGIKAHIWLGTNYGACDIPNVKGYDIIIHYGHTRWKKNTPKK